MDSIEVLQIAANDRTVEQMKPLFASVTREKIQTFLTQYEVKFKVRDSKFALVDLAVAKLVAFRNSIDGSGLSLIKWATEQMQTSSSSSSSSSASSASASISSKPKSKSEPKSTVPSSEAGMTIDIANLKVSGTVTDILIN
jgi:hypothetical protein